jgi:hypothetical protein
MHTWSAFKVALRIVLREQKLLSKGFGEGRNRLEIVRLRGSSDPSDIAA